MKGREGLNCLREEQEGQEEAEEAEEERRRALKLDLSIPDP